MKRDLKLNMEHLSGTVDSIENYLACIGSLKDACTAFLEVLKKQDSVSYTTLSEEWEKDIIGNIGEMEERLTQMKTTLSGYIEDMESYVAPESPGTMMRVDRNDIWYNISQIGSGISKVFDICCDSGSSFPDYKHPFINWFSKDAAAIRLAEEQERGRRERNYDKLAGFRSGSVSSAFRIFSDEVDEIWSIYNNAIVPFENTDDDYSQDARFWYDMWATTGNKLGDLGEGIKNLGRGLWDAAVDLVDGVFSLALYLIFGGFVFSGTVSLPDMVEERCKGVDAGIQAMLKDPLGTIEVLGQSMTDTYEEEGLAYAAGYISLDVITEIVATKGLGGAKGATKVADTASDAASVAKKVDTVTDVAGAAKKVDTVTDAASAAKKVETLADTADTAADAARAADKTADAAGAAKKVDTVTDTASAAKKADTATDAADAVYTVDKVEETSDAAKAADKTADVAEKVDGLEAKGGTGSGTASEVESIPEPNLGVEGDTPTVEKVFTDNPFDESGNLKPNSKYQTGEFKYNYETDANGRISNWNTDNLQLTERDARLNYNPDTPGKIEGDHAGHLAGDRFGGSPELDNLVSQSQNVNLSQYKKIENQWAKAISEGKEVTVNVDIKYDGDGLRPIEFNVEYTIDGDFFSQSILN